MLFSLGRFASIMLTKYGFCQHDNEEEKQSNSQRQQSEHHGYSGGVLCNAIRAILVQLPCPQREKDAYESCDPTATNTRAYVVGEIVTIDFHWSGF